MGFKNLYKEDMKNVILNDDEFASEVEYLVGGLTNRTIKGVFNFSLINTMNEDFGHSLHKTAEVVFVNDATHGIEEVDFENDRITFTDQSGTERTARVLQVLSHDGTSWKLLIGW